MKYSDIIGDIIKEAMWNVTFIDVGNKIIGK